MILVLIIVTLSTRTLAAVLMNSSFVYFLHPILATAAVGCVFLGSVLIGKPIVARLAQDFCPLPPEVRARPRIAGLYRGLTFLWAGVNLLTATMTLLLLTAFSTEAFVVLKQLVGLSITVGAIAWTVAWSLRVARQEGLVSADAGDAILKLAPA